MSNREQQGQTSAVEGVRCLTMLDRGPKCGRRSVRAKEKYGVRRQSGVTGTVPMVLDTCHDTSSCHSRVTSKSSLAALPRPNSRAQLGIDWMRVGATCVQGRTTSITTSLVPSSGQWNGPRRKSPGWAVRLEMPVYDKSQVEPAHRVQPRRCELVLKLEA